MARFTLHACFRPVDGAICAERYRAGGVAAKTTERGARRIERPVPPAARVLMTGRDAHCFASRIVAEPVLDIVLPTFPAHISDRLRRLRQRPTRRDFQAALS